MLDVDGPPCLATSRNCLRLLRNVATSGPRPRCAPQHKCRSSDRTHVRKLARCRYTRPRPLPVVSVGYGPSTRTEVTTNSDKEIKTMKFSYPADANYLLRKKRAIRKQLVVKPDLLEIRVAILGGSTTAEVKDILELYLLNDGFRPVFYESGFNRYYEDVAFSKPALKEFNPDVFYIHTTSANISKFPSLHSSSDVVDRLIAEEVARFSEIWDLISKTHSCAIIQNNFELPHFRTCGNLDNYAAYGRSRFTNELNFRFAEEASRRPYLYLNDINYLSSWFGLERWYDRFFWYSYKYAMNIEAIPLLTGSVSAIINAIYGRSKKCLVLDLDNTLWGGVIGEDGIDGIRIGMEMPESEAYTDFQNYVKGLKDRGVILAVCSKNDQASAIQGFSHPDSILSAADFADFRANWEPKHENIRNIAQALNIGLDSVVFADDNPVERDIVRSQEPEVAVLELGENVAKYIDVLDKSGYFESVALAPDDLARTAFYVQNASRQEAQLRFSDYGDFLRSLQMKARIEPFSTPYLERIVQLINKTNQFNLTTKRYTIGEIQSLAEDSDYITLCGRLRDKFGDNGLVSVMIGRVEGSELRLEVWLMSCRVFQRGLELAMLDQFVLHAQRRGLKSILGRYVPTAKNGIVSELFSEMGFEYLSTDSDHSTSWRLDITSGYSPKNRSIEVTNES